MIFASINFSYGLAGAAGFWEFPSSLASITRLSFETIGIAVALFVVIVVPLSFWARDFFGKRNGDDKATDTTPKCNQSLCDKRHAVLEQRVNRLEQDFESLNSALRDDVRRIHERINNLSTGISNLPQIIIGLLRDSKNL
jgi:hypothetical protein